MADITEAKKLLLAEYERERDELNVVISRLRRELGHSDSGAETEGESARAAAVATATGLAVKDLVTPGDFFGMTQVAAAKVFLQRRNKQTASMQEIAAALYLGKATDSPMESVAALRNLSSLISRSGEFVSVARGRWGLVEWYPDRVIKKHRKAKNGDEDLVAEATENPKEKEEPK